MTVERYQPIHLSAFEGMKSWGIQDVTLNGDNILRDWRYKGTKRRIWRGVEEEARTVARYLCEHPEILEKDARQASRSGRTGAILRSQRTNRVPKRGKGS